jgi:putative hydrolase of the HAD superfamily
MAIRYLMFDFFGTLAQYEDGVAGNPTGRSIRFLNSLGIEIGEQVFSSRFQDIWDAADHEARLSLRESHMHQMAASLFSSLGYCVSKTQIAEFSEQYIEDWSEGVLAIDGLPAMLGRIGLPSCIVSNTYYPSLVPSLVQRLGLKHCFERIVTSVDQGYRKPHPSIYQAALSSAGVDSAEVLFVGDNPECDYHAPRRIGMQAVLISTTPREGVDERHRLPSITDLHDYLPLLGQRRLIATESLSS